MDLSKRYNAGTRYHAPRSFPEYNEDHDFRVLNWNEWQFWLKNGYLLIPNVVPINQCERLIEATWQYLDADADNPSSWYTIPANNDDKKTRKSIAGMVELYHHPAQWTNRQHPRIYNTFVDLWGTEKLWVSLDRVNINLPNRKSWKFEGFLHWDIDISQTPLACNIQGVLSLSDTVSGMGGLQIVPELFLQMEEWLYRQPKNRDPRLPDLSGFDVLDVESHAGDLVIWDSRMAHGTGRNYSERPRIAQFISMTPAEPHESELLQIRIESFKNRTGPALCGMPGDELEYRFGPPAILSGLGEKLLGCEPWG